MANYQVTITNGTGSEEMLAGNYNVTADVTGYDNATLSPATFTATESEQTQAFTIRASGTLTFIVNETGAAGGTPITAGSIQMTNADGSVDYGAPVTIGTDGNAVFDNVPYGTTAEPYTLYFRQLASDGTHNVQEGVITVNMTAQTQTEYIQNTAAATQNFTLTDEVYSMPVSGTLDFTEVE